MMIAQNLGEYFETKFSADDIGENLFRTNNEAFYLICEKKVKSVEYRQAVEYFKTDVEDIYELAEKRQWHRIHNKIGAKMIGAESLFELLKKRPTQRLEPEFLSLAPADYKTNEDI